MNDPALVTDTRTRAVVGCSPDSQRVTSDDAPYLR